MKPQALGTTEQKRHWQINKFHSFLYIFGSASPKQIKHYNPSSEAIKMVTFTSLSMEKQKTENLWGLPKLYVSCE